MKKLFAVSALLIALTIASGSVLAAGNNRPAATTTPVSELTGYTAPKLVKMVRPDAIYINNRPIEGYVTLELLVNDTGTVDKAKVLYRTSQLAVANAVDAASKWKFEPAKVNGKPVKSYIAFNVPFGRQLDAFQESSYASSVVNGGEYGTLASK